jgi:hypothetical protein
MPYGHGESVRVNEKTFARLFLKSVGKGGAVLRVCQEGEIHPLIMSTT